MINGLPYAQVPQNAAWKDYVDVLEKALIEHPEDEVKILRALVGYTSLEPARYDRCIEVAERLLLLSDDEEDRAEALLSKAMALHDQKKNLEEAEALYIQVYEISREYQQPFERLIDIYLDRKDLDSAMLWAERMLEEDGLDRLGLEHKGTVLLEMGRLDEALEIFEACLKDNPYPASVHFGIAKCHLDRVDYGKACEALIKAFETCHYPEPLYSYGAGYAYHHMDDPYRAMKWYAKTLDIDPSYPNALNNMAVLNLELENGWGEALPYLLKAVELSGEALNPSMQIVYRNLWAYYSQILDKEKADHYYRLVLKCTGLDDDAIDLLGDLSDN